MSSPLPLPRRALIAITSAQATLFENDGHRTGVFISEALHPYLVFRAADFEVDIASETGEWSADWLSLQPGFMTEEQRAMYEDRQSEFRGKMDAARRAGDVDAGKYGVFFASAGHAALIDYPHAKGLKGIAGDVYERGGVVGTVCHGPAIFPGVNSPTTNKSIISGKTITGFTDEGEDVLGVTDALKKWGEPFVEEIARNLGAKYVRPSGVWDDYHIIDGRIVTGTNPASATSTAEAVVKVFEGLAGGKD